MTVIKGTVFMTTDTSLVYSCVYSEHQWQRIVEMNQVIGNGGEATKQVLYCATIVFFTSAFHYACGMMPSEFAGMFALRSAYSTKISSLYTST